MFKAFAQLHSDTSIATRLQAAVRPSPALFADIVEASPRLVMLRTMGKTRHLDRLLACEAWGEAAMAMIGLEAPCWNLQRLRRDDGEWVCTLTRFTELPDWLDDGAEGRHPVMALAILAALLEVRARPQQAETEISQAAGAAADASDYR